MNLFDCLLNQFNQTDYNQIKLIRLEENRLVEEAFAISEIRPISLAKCFALNSFSSSNFPSPLLLGVQL